MLIILSWVLINSYFLSRYIQVVNYQDNVPFKIIAIFVISWVVLSSYYACYHVVSFVFSLLALNSKSKHPKCYGSTPKVAILYPCMNDFQEHAVDSYLCQSYQNYHIFILDDSTVPEEKEKVDDYVKSHSQKITLIRRKDRSHFKAGNLNNAIRQLDSDYKYFAIMDADEIISCDFTKETVAILEANSKVGFVQTCHDLYGKTVFGQMAGEGIDPHFKYFLPARNRFGFVYLYGHGVMVRTQACLDVGGIPEIVSEDVALATRMRIKGYHGIYADDIVCQEEVPPTYEAWRKRNGKFVRGTLEFFTKEFPDFIRAKNISLTEKIDLSTALSVLYIPIFFLVFLVLIHVVLPFFVKDSYSITVLGENNAQHGYIHTAMAIFRPLWGWDTFVFTLFSVFASLCYLIPCFIRSPLRVMRYILRMTTVHLSVSLQTLIESANWILTKKAMFCSTGNRKTQALDKKMSTKVEGYMGYVVIVCSIITGSICLMSLGISLALIPLMLRSNFPGKVCAVLILLPMILTIISFGLVPMGLLGISGAFVGFAFAHH